MPLTFANLLQEGWIEKETEKRINSSLQLWIRAPTMSIYGFLCWQAFLYGTHSAGVSVFSLAVVALLHFYNGVYYAGLAVYAHGRFVGEGAGRKEK